MVAVHNDPWLRAKPMYSSEGMILLQKCAQFCRVDQCSEGRKLLAFWWRLSNQLTQVPAVCNPIGRWKSTLTIPLSHKSASEVSQQCVNRPQLAQVLVKFIRVFWVVVWLQLIGYCDVRYGVQYVGNQVFQITLCRLKVLDFLSHCEWDDVINTVIIYVHT